MDTVLGWRGRTVVDRDGEKIGKLEQVYLDDADPPGWGAVHTGLFGLKRTFVPLYEASEGDDRVMLPYTRDHVGDAPSADPDVHLDPEDEERLYRHYELGETAAPARERSGEMLRSEEEPVVTDTHRVPRERVRIKKVLVTDHVTKTIPVKREKLALEDPGQDPERGPHPAS